MVMDRTFWRRVVCFAFWLICFFSHRDIGSAAFRRCLGIGPGSSVSLPRKQHHDFFYPSTSAVALVRPFLKFSRRYSCNCEVLGQRSKAQREPFETKGPL